VSVRESEWARRKVVAHGRGEGVSASTLGTRKPWKKKKGLRREMPGNNTYQLERGKDKGKTVDG